MTPRKPSQQPLARVPKDLPHPFQNATGRVECTIPRTGGQLFHLDAVDPYVGLPLRAPLCPDAGAGIVTHIDPEDSRRGVVVWLHATFPDPNTPVVPVSLREVLAVDPVFLKYRGKVPSSVVAARPSVSRDGRVYRDLLAYLLGDGQAKQHQDWLPAMGFNATLTHGWPLAVGFWRTAQPWSSAVQLYPPTVKNPGGVISITSRALPQLRSVINDAYEFFPIEGKRHQMQRCRVRPGVLDNVMDAQMLAILVACDGARDKKALLLCTNGFPLEDVEVLVRVLHTRLGLDCWSVNRRTRLASGVERDARMIYIPVRAMDRVQELVFPHLHPLYRYKVSPDWLRLAPPWTPPKKPPGGISGQSPILISRDVPSHYSVYPDPAMPSPKRPPKKASRASQGCNLPTEEVGGASASPCTATRSHRTGGD